MKVTECALVERNERLEELWALDESMRSLHQGGAWKSGAVGPSDALRGMAIHRQQLVSDLRAMGAVPWDYHPVKDNCWMAVQRHRVIE